MEAQGPAECEQESESLFKPGQIKNTDSSAFDRILHLHIQSVSLTAGIQGSSVYNTYKNKL